MTITAVFGIEASTLATIACSDQADSFALAALNTAAVSILAIEQGDGCAITAGTLLAASLPIQDAADSCALNTHGGIDVALPIVEWADIASISLVDVPNPPPIFLPMTSTSFTVRSPQDNYLVRVPKVPAVVDEE